jgi:hypothetical protein
MTIVLSRQPTHSEEIMRFTSLLAIGITVTAITGCRSGPGLKVRTTVEPGADLTGLHTFYVLTPPTRSANATPLAANDPMLENSITNTALRTDLTQAFQSRGYAPAARQGADFLVAYYAGAKEKTPAGDTRTGGAEAGHGRITGRATTATEAAST